MILSLGIFDDYIQPGSVIAYMFIIAFLNGMLYNTDIRGVQKHAAVSFKEDRMTITIVCDVLGEENNGTTIAAMNLIRSLKSKGHNVRTLNLWPFNKYVEKVGVTLAKPDRHVIEQALDGADIVHIMIPFSLGNAALKIAKKDHLPVTAGFHCQAENITAYLGMERIDLISRFIYFLLYRIFYRKVDAIHYPSSFIRDIFESRIQKKTKGYVISNGVNPYVMKRETKKISEWDERIVILTTGRYSREKAQDVLLRAVLHSKHKEKIQLVLAGQGVREIYYRMLARKLPNSPVFRFYTRQEIVDVLNSCDLYVHTANMELEGIACLEAIKCGKLTIVSDSPLSATRNFAIDQSCIFQHGKPKQLARVIDYWIDHPDQKKEYELKYLDSSYTFDQDYCMDRMEKMFYEVVNAG